VRKFDRGARSNITYATIDQAGKRWTTALVIRQTWKGYRYRVLSDVRGWYTDLC
jgi:hypothetical protein